MARWEGDAYQRLREAAFALFVEQGFERTTVAQIAERAGVNRRTFFHHFTDKREVVFADQAGSEEFLTTAIRDQPESAGPLHAAVAALQAAVGTRYEQHRDAAVALGRVIAASPELRERELAKRSTLAETIAAALRDRGTPDAAAAVAGWTAVSVFFVARNRWNQAANRHTLAELIDLTLHEFLTTAVPAPPAPPAPPGSPAAPRAVET